jgi:hypothetical protein
MSTLTSASTDAQVWAAYDDAASYEEDGDAAKCKAFITACRFVLRRRPQTFGRGEQSGTFEAVASELESARQWLAANPSSTGAGSRTSERFADLSAYRD